MKTCAVERSVARPGSSPSCGARVSGSAIPAKPAQRWCPAEGRQLGVCRWDPIPRASCAGAGFDAQPASAARRHV